MKKLTSCANFPESPLVFSFSISLKELSHENFFFLGFKN
jgi:hypothetical protein